MTFRLYGPRELARDGYPPEWHETIKHVVREQAGHRCLRCGHPFVVGQSGVMEGAQAGAKAFAAELGLDVETLDQALTLLEADALVLDKTTLDQARRTNWSPCDGQCTHAGPVRVQGEFGDWSEPLDDVDIAAELDSGFNVQAAWRILTVHHLDGNKANCRWWNLTALCQRCHLYIQRTVQMERVYPWEHDDWFKPYAAGYYAFVYLGEDLDRDETEARLDELLALERVA